MREITGLRLCVLPFHRVPLNLMMEGEHPFVCVIVKDVVTSTIVVEWREAHNEMEEIRAEHLSVPLRDRNRKGDAARRLASGFSWNQIAGCMLWIVRFDCNQSSVFPLHS